MNIAPLTEVRNNLRHVVDTVTETGTEQIVTLHGEPAVIILAFDEYLSMVELIGVLSNTSDV